MGEKSKSGLIIAGIIALGLGAGAVYLLRKRPVATTHKVCSNGSCITIDGVGQNECSQDGDCLVVGCVPATCTRTEQCPDGSTITTRECQNNQCVDTGNQCGVGCNPATCTSTLNCWDGSIITIRECQSNQCLSTGQQCPLEPVCTPGSKRCMDSGVGVETCRADGSGYVQTDTCLIGCTNGLCNISANVNPHATRTAPMTYRLDTDYFDVPAGYTLIHRVTDDTEGVNYFLNRRIAVPEGDGVLVLENNYVFPDSTIGHDFTFYVELENAEGIIIDNDRWQFRAS